MSVKWFDQASCAGIEAEGCPLCPNPAGSGECPESVAERKHSVEDLEPTLCPCCDACRKRCAEPDTAEEQAFDALIARALRGEFDVEAVDWPLDLSKLPELTDDEAAAFDALGTPEEFIDRVFREAARREAPKPGDPEAPRQSATTPDGRPGP